jgi:DNA-binding response OmpR family regulator
MAETIKKKVLIAEDDKFISKAYAAGLIKAGFEVLIAHDGNEAMKMLKEHCPDVLLLDIMMPEKSGFEVLEEMKVTKTCAKIPVLVLSNLGQDSDIEKGKSLGAKDFLIKANHSMKQVVEKVKETLATVK